MKIGVSTSCLYPLETEKALLKLAQAGIKTTEIFFNASCELKKDFVGLLKSIANDYGISIISVHPTMSLAESFMLFSNYPRRYEEGIEQYKRYAEIACELSAKYIIMHGGKPNRAIDNEEYFHRFSVIAQMVKENGAELLQENVVNFRAGSLSALADMKKYLGADAAFCLDIKQCVRGGYSPFEALSLLRDSVKHIHISDNLPGDDCMLPLKGNFDFISFFNLCDKVGYKGDAVIEVYREAYNKPDEIFASYNALAEIIDKNS